MQVNPTQSSFLASFFLPFFLPASFLLSQRGSSSLLQLTAGLLIVITHLMQVCVGAVGARAEEAAF